MAAFLPVNTRGRRYSRTLFRAPLRVFLSAAYLIVLITGFGTAIIGGFTPLGARPSFLVPIAAQTPVPPGPYDESVTLDLWTTEDIIIHDVDTTPEERLLREARYTLSGLIYGWRFSYTPGDARRDVSERFDLEPVGTVPRGSPGLRVRELRSREGTLYGHMEYVFTTEEKARLRRLRSFATARSTGEGTGPLLEGATGKIQSIENAIHQALREHLRGRYPNRPREVLGTVALARPPRVRTVAGEYEARVMILLDIEEVHDYRVF